MDQQDQALIDPQIAETQNSFSLLLLYFEPLNICSKFLYYTLRRNNIIELLNNVHYYLKSLKYSSNT